MNRLLVLFAVLAAMVVALAMASPADNNDNKWFKNPGSPTERRVLKDDVGQEIHYTHDPTTGHRTTGYLAKGKNTRQSPPRDRQPSTGGEPSTSQKKGKGKGK
ncbi:Cytochrome c-type biogenesis protein CcmE [Frankliniella fusca]|uniref:Cytochrome c-type biogenesis protein CcmE n=1 Tax=Frankliniella fusca TaxID=407009 RepID=A0AAE1LRT9_9NEOP|nr:Cytochrome c-type biogenesis protein CcmE [Frankliniella fusca]